MTAVAHPLSPIPWASSRSLVAGVVAAVSLVVVYVSIISLAQGVDHALDQLRADALFVSLIAAGFGVQIGLFTELRTVGRRHRAAVAATAAGTGTSAAAMLACCAHHLVELLPLVGLSAAAVFLNAYRTPLFLVGMGLSLVGITVVGRQLRQARRACALVERADAS